MNSSLLKKSISSLALSLVTGSISVAKTSETYAPPKKPNFLFIMVDDLGWADLGCYGSTFHETPHVDKLCSSGMKFTDAYATAPVCSPTRASVLSGKYPARTKLTDFLGGPQPDQTAKKKWMLKKSLLPARWLERMKLEEETIAETLKANGYSTFFAGKWHVGHHAPLWPEHQGFDVNIGGCNKGGPYGGKGYFSPYNNPRITDGPDGEHLPDRLASETCKFMLEKKSEPFFAYLSFYSVHTPLMARPDLVKKYMAKKKALGIEEEWKATTKYDARSIQNHAVYAGMVEAMDMAVGKVLSCLKQNGLDKNTVVIFMSDNGGLSTAGGSPTCNLPLRAGKGWMYEGGIREPMIIRWPGVTAAGGLCSEPVTSTDFYPTILEMAGIPSMPEQHMDGKSLAPLLMGKSMKRGDIFWHYPHWGHQGGSPSGAIRSGDWKLIEFFTDNRLELYNIRTDIGEANNLAVNMPKRTKAMHTRLVKWRHEVDAKMPTRNENIAK